MSDLNPVPGPPPEETAAIKPVLAKTDSELKKDEKARLRDWILSLPGGSYVLMALFVFGVLIELGKEGKEAGDLFDSLFGHSHPSPAWVANPLPPELPVPGSPAQQPPTMAADQVLFEKMKALAVVPSLNGAQLVKLPTTEQLVVEGPTHPRLVSFNEDRTISQDGDFNVVIPAGNPKARYNGLNIYYPADVALPVFITAQMKCNGELMRNEIEAVGFNFIVDCKQEQYYQWASQTNFYNANPLPAGLWRMGDFNTLSVYQEGRFVAMFLNGKKVDVFDMYYTPAPGKVGVASKCEVQSVCVMNVQSLAVYSYSHGL